MSRETPTRALPGRIILATGGTGGHMVPAQALARELLGRGLDVTLITDRRGGGFVAPTNWVGIHCLGLSTAPGFLYTLA